MNNQSHNHLPAERIVLKLARQAGSSFISAPEASDLISRLLLPAQSTLAEITPENSLDKLFTSLQPGTIDSMVDKACRLDAGYTAIGFNQYYALNCPGGTEITPLLSALIASPDIELAYLQNTAGTPPATSYNITQHQAQGYLNAAPEGIDARYAWQIAGGKGHDGIRLTDIEQGWMTDHVAVPFANGPLFGRNHYWHADHGTAVMGIVMMQDNQQGITGISPRIQPGFISQWRPDGSFNTPDAILSAASLLQAGDIILLEAQCFDGPESSSAWPVEIEEANFQAIRLASALGIIVIEAAGNGDRATNTGNDLDQFIVNGNEIFNQAFRDSGAIMVGAGSSRVPHTRTMSSNYGKRLNCYAWGEHVATAGYYPGASGAATNTYTRKFCGTSSAAAIIAGAAASLQGIVTTAGLSGLNPKQMRHVLGNYGTASANGKAIDKIGMMPDLQKIIRHVLPTSNLLEQTS